MYSQLKDQNEMNKYSKALNVPIMKMPKEQINNKV